MFKRAIACVAFQCLACKRCFLQPHLLVWHKKTTPCGISFPYLIATEEIEALGISHHEKEERRPEGEFSCPICLRKYHTHNQLRAHLALHRKRKDGYPCYFCPQKVLNMEELAAHLAQHTEEVELHAILIPPNATQEKKAKSHGLRKRISATLKRRCSLCVCVKCQKLFGNRILLKKHVQRMHTHREKRMRWCTLCRKSFVCNQNYKRHLKSLSHRCSCSMQPGFHF